ncbi:hypothetical protein B0H67DRAFT_674039 [Lasiosphaeris hirsuta]|uniref:Uncharacterized protein n=1 Tax=Lasiosphaeris hirsuta TaxID=260670 RepID=A0AA39ZW22_9PEZI|nr:hypothetical protein B0H67DRAFT_674039 [Lasiosphaeris hirsuta]
MAPPVPPGVPSDPFPDPEEGNEDEHHVLLRTSYPLPPSYLWMTLADALRFAAWTEFWPANRPGPSWAGSTPTSYQNQQQATSHGNPPPPSPGLNPAAAVFTPGAYPGACEYDLAVVTSYNVDQDWRSQASTFHSPFRDAEDGTSLTDNDGDEGGEGTESKEKERPHQHANLTWVSPKEKMHMRHNSIKSQASHTGLDESPFFPKSLLEYNKLLADIQEEQAGRLKSTIKQREAALEAKKHPHWMKIPVVAGPDGKTEEILVPLHHTTPPSPKETTPKEAREGKEPSAYHPSPIPPPPKLTPLMDKPDSTQTNDPLSAVLALPNPFNPAWTANTDPLGHIAWPSAAELSAARRGDGDGLGFGFGFGVASGSAVLPVPRRNRLDMRFVWAVPAPVEGRGEGKGEDEFFPGSGEFEPEQVSWRPRRAERSKSEREGEGGVEDGVDIPLELRERLADRWDFHPDLRRFRNITDFSRVEEFDDLAKTTKRNDQV